MTGSEQIRATIDRYIAAVGAGDPDAVAALFTADATVEDPVGSEPHRGIEAVRAFYEMAGSLADRLTPTRTGAICVAGRQAAFPFTIRTETGGATFEIDAIDVMTFDDDGRITSMRAFWDGADIRTVT
jgi:steroid delta-isomerase